MRVIPVVVMTGLLLATCLPVEAQDNGPSAGQAILSAAFTAAERETIHQYFVRHPDQLQAVDQFDQYAHQGGGQEYGGDQEQYQEQVDRKDHHEEGGDQEDRDGEDHDREDDDGEHGNWHSHHHGRGHGHGWKHEAGGMPPGIAMNFEVGKPLPPGIARQIRPLPRALARELPPPPRGCERVEVDGKVLLVAIATHVIYDVIEDAVLGDQQRRHR